MAYSREDRLVLIISVLASAMAFIDGTVVNLATGEFIRSFDASLTQVTWIVESYLLLFTALLLLGGALGDHFGPRRILLIGTIFFGIASILCGLAQSPQQLIVFRAIQGLGAAVMVPNSLALIYRCVHERRRALAVGSWSAWTAISGAAGPLIGGLLIQELSWRWIFYLNIPLAITVITLLSIAVPRESSVVGNHRRLDWLGASTATIALGGLVFGLIESVHLSFRDPLVITALAIGVVFSVIFVLTQLRENAMIPLKFFFRPGFGTMNLHTLLVYGALGGAFFFLPLYFIQVLGMQESIAAAAVLPFPVLVFLLSRLSMRASERFGPILPLMLGPLLVLVGYIIFALSAGQTSYWQGYVFGVLSMGSGMGILVAPLTSTVLNAIPAEDSGIASGVNNMVARLGGLVALPVFSILVASSFWLSADDDLNRLNLNANEQAQLSEQERSLAGVEFDETVPAERASSILDVLRAAFTEGFRGAMWLAAGLVALAVLCTVWFAVTRKRGALAAPRESES